MAKNRMTTLVTLLLVTLLLASTITVHAESPPTADSNVIVGAAKLKSETEMLREFWQMTDGKGNGGMSPAPAVLDKELLARAQPDECFDGIGKPYPAYNNGCAQGVPKVNDAYVWGLVLVGDNLWFGTIANTLCLVAGGYFGVDPYKTKDYVCEFGESQYAKNGDVSGANGDWRPPNLYAFNTATKTLTDKSNILDAGGQALLQKTLGIRSAGAFGNVVILGGPHLSTSQGINLFAFNATTGNFIASTTLRAYTDIRRWVVVNDVLYAGVGNADGGGSVLRWRGNEANPFQFEAVAWIEGDAAELAYHDGRLFVSTWPGRSLGDILEPSGLWMSPPIPEGGLWSVHANSWKKVWEVTRYEPDPIVARTYGGGALFSFDGYLYWGTMHVPLVATLAHYTAYWEARGFEPNREQLEALFLGTNRAISIFRGRNFGTKPEIQLVYGESKLPVFLPGFGTSPGRWILVPTRMTPLYGPSGINSRYNNYTWSMAAHQGKLFVGTMDWSYIAADVLGGLGVQGASPSVNATLAPQTIVPGADLYSFSSSSAPAVAVGTNGLGNYTSYGIRNMVSGPDGLYLGTANPMNLLTNLTDAKPEGGWELIRLKGVVQP